MRLHPTVSLSPMQVAPLPPAVSHSHSPLPTESRMEDTFVPRTRSVSSATHSHHEEDSASSDLPALAHVHTDNDDEILSAVANMPVSATTLAERAIATSNNLELSEPCLPTLAEFPGTYQVAEGGGYAGNSFTIEPQDVISGSQTPAHLDEVRSQAEADDHDDSGVAAYLTLRKENVTFKSGLLGFILNHIPGDVVYILTVSKKGVVRFHLPPDRSILTKLLFSFADSEPGFFSWFKNLGHLMKHGCYCFGLFFRGQPTGSTEDTNARPVLMRYNRWDGGVAPYWAAVSSGPKANEAGNSSTRH